MAWFDIPRTLRDAMLAAPAVNDGIGNRVHYQELPSSSNSPHIWFARSNRDRDQDLDGSDSVTIERFSLEIVSDQNCEPIIDDLIEALEGLEGEYSGKWIGHVEVEDADDDYLFQSVGENAPDFLHALQVAVYVTPLN